MGGTATLSVNGKKVAEGRIAHTAANVFSVDEGVTVGVDDETTVTTDYKERANRFRMFGEDIRTGPWVLPELTG